MQGSCKSLASATSLCVQRKQIAPYWLGLPLSGCSIQTRGFCFAQPGVPKHKDSVKPSVHFSVHFSAFSKKFLEDARLGHAAPHEACAQYHAWAGQSNAFLLGKLTAQGPIHNHGLDGAMKYILLAWCRRICGSCACTSLRTSQDGHGCGGSTRLALLMSAR